MSTDPTTPLTPVQGHTDLISNAWLMSYNLAINQVHHLWICLDCNIALLTSSVVKHTTKSTAHPGGPSPIPQFIDMLATQNNMAMVYPDTTHIIDAIDGLRVQTVTSCSACRLFGVKKKTITNHISALHKGLTPAPTPQGTYNAQYFNNSNKTLFEVTVRNVPPPPAPGDHDTADLRQLVALPSVRKDLPRLGATVIAYFKKAEATLKSIDHIILCKLNTKDIAKTAVNNTPLHGLEQEASLQAYCRTVTHLVAGLLRAHSTPGYKFPTNPTLDTAIGALHTSLQDAAQTGFNELHAVFLSLFGTLWTAKDDPEEATAIIGWAGLIDFNKGTKGRSRSEKFGGATRTRDLVKLRRVKKTMEGNPGQAECRVRQTMCQRQPGRAGRTRNKPGKVRE
ncbi:hypothetical protein C8J56DRAFT_894830 [Mycena floridula]|nr:hypothetical protein C8J56DRAFT_894830 [Mycena floridula]